MACSPHPRGDGPPHKLFGPRLGEFSPPAWGWSSVTVIRTSLRSVLPTRVGMVRQPRAPRLLAPRSPHPRGDGPGDKGRGVGSRAFSPPAWGWSDRFAAECEPVKVLPTRVGMVRGQRVVNRDTECSPHPRGDGPLARLTRCPVWAFSPPAWGWSDHFAGNADWQKVLPTRVGMVRRLEQISRKGPSSPHPRGDGPLSCV